LHLLITVTIPIMKIIIPRQRSLSQPPNLIIFRAAD
jgi:hypothetical protein